MKEIHIIMAIHLNPVTYKGQIVIVYDEGICMFYTVVSPGEGLCSGED